MFQAIDIICPTPIKFGRKYLNWVEIKQIKTVNILGINQRIIDKLNILNFILK